MSRAGCRLTIRGTEQSDTVLRAFWKLAPIGSAGPLKCAPVLADVAGAQAPDYSARMRQGSGRELADATLVDGVIAEFIASAKRGEVVLLSEDGAPVGAVAPLDVVEAGLRALGRPPAVG